MLATLSARMLTVAIVPTMRMKSVWVVVGQVPTALLCFITQRILPTSTLAVGTNGTSPELVFASAELYSHLLTDVL